MSGGASEYGGRVRVARTDVDLVCLPDAPLALSALCYCAVLSVGLAAELEPPRRLPGVEEVTGEGKRKPGSSASCAASVKMKSRKDCLLHIHSNSFLSFIAERSCV